MIESYLRPSYQRFFMDPVAKLLGRLAVITPNRITLTAAVFGVMAALLFVMHVNKYVAVILLLVSGFCDALDGSIARMYGDVTQRGAAWDIVSDRLVEFVIMAALYFYNPAHNALGVLIMLGASYLCVTTFLVVAIFSENTGQKSFYYSNGLIERLEAFVFFIVMMLFPVTIPWLAWVYAGLVFYTAVTHMIEFHKRYSHFS